MIFSLRCCARYHFPSFRFSPSRMSILAALLLAATSPAPEIRSEALGDRRYRIVLTAPGLTLAEGQDKATEEAVRLCGGPPVTLGHYRFNSEERRAGASGERTPIALTLEQEADCGAGPPPHAPVPSGWEPTRADMDAVLDFTVRYFAARDAGRYEEAWSLLTPSMQEMSPLAQWQARQAAFNRRSGGGLGRRPVAITWYDNPSGAPHPGIFAAVDFVGKSKELLFVCGYLVWLRQPDGSWRLTREEEGTLGRAQSRASSPEQLAQARAAMGCREPG
jgi:hypothetical protein